MRILLVTIFMIFSNYFFGQEVKYGEVIENGYYDTYHAKDGSTVSVGDTIKLGQPSGNDHFLFIQQGGQYVAPWLADKDVIVTRIKSYGSKKKGYILFVQFKGFGMLPVFIQYDNAVEAGEVLPINAALTREQAIAKLKEYKELLDLELITIEKYDSIKSILSPLIMNK
jgi:hypothetical protein